jgi:hypothetical protein
MTKNDDRDALEEAAVRLAAALGSDGLLVGGLAVAASGRRTTSTSSHGFRRRRWSGG